MLIKQELSSLSLDRESKSKNNSVHRIFCIDCSGSMSSSLSLLRTHLKNKISKMIQPDDFFTLVWFSGSGQYGTIFEHMSINDISDLQTIHQTIDRYVKSVGLTGFVEPIRLCKTLVEKYSEIAHVFFMSDGGENSWPISECEKAFEEMQGIPMVIVEYQYYCDRVFLKRLAELSGSVSVFNENFESFDTTFNTYMKNKVTSFKRMETSLPVIYFDENVFTIKKPVENIVKLPNHIETVWQVDEKPFVFETDERYVTNDEVKHVYMTMLYALQTKSKGVMQHCIDILGDVYLSKLYASCFSKQDYSQLTQYITNCIFEPSVYAFKEGVDLTFKVQDNAFNVVEFLQLLSKDEKVKFYPYHPTFKYDRISKEVKDDHIQFIPNRELGSKVDLVYHQQRANISLGCKVYGHEMDENDTIKAVTNFRNYTVLKDGIKNIKVLPVSMSKETFDVLVKEKCIKSDEVYERNRVYFIDLTDLPVVNRQFVLSSISSTDFCKYHVDLHKNKSVLKYLKKVIEMNVKEDAKEDEEVKQSYEKADKNAVRDFYIAPELQVKIAKCSTIPTVNQKLIEKLNAYQEKKLTLSESLMLDIHEQYTHFCEEHSDLSERMTWLSEKVKEYRENGHFLTTILEQAKMALLIGGVWFSDCPEDQHTFQVDSFEVTVEINDSRVYMD